MINVTPTPNIPLLRKVVEWVEEQETLTEGRQWRQATWIVSEQYIGPGRSSAYFNCGTAYCVAGKIAIDAGWTPIWEGAGGRGEQAADEVTKNGVTMDVGQVARLELGLSYPQGNALFAGSNDAADIRRNAELIAGERL